jgi:hypothetical protein
MAHMLRQAAALGALVFLAACGGGSPAAPPTPAPTPTPAPAPTPTPTPTPDPCSQGLCEPPTTNTAPPVRLILRLFQLFDAQGTWVLPTPDPVRQVVGEPIPLGYSIRLDFTGRDKDDEPTNGSGKLEIVVSDPDLVDIAISGDFQRKVKVLKPGKWEIYGVLDGVASNSLGFTFCDPKLDAACKYP